MMDHFWYTQLEKKYKEIFGIGMNKLFSMNLCGIKGLTAMMYLHGTLMIQAGYNTKLVEEVVKSYLPCEILDEYDRRTLEKALPGVLTLDDIYSSNYNNN